jgi:CheY-like chemotaxis protein
MEPNAATTGPIHVLFVEDEFLISELVSQSLSEQGFAVQTVSNAADALAHLASVAVDVLFIDIKLPGRMDGAALARRAREMQPGIPVVYAAARVRLRTRHSAYAGRASSRLHRRAKTLRARACRSIAGGGHEGGLGRSAGVNGGYGAASPRARNSSSQ